MDSLTQIVLGTAVGQVLLGKEAGNKALLWGAVAGTIPDLDIIPGQFVDTVTRLEMHRGFSHSFLFALSGSPMFGWLVSKIHKKVAVPWYKWAHLFFWGIVTHFLLDNFTTWGTQVFYPFDYRVAWRTIFVIDPLYTIPFLICLIIVFFSKEHRFRRKVNYIGLTISSLYLLISVINKNIVNHVVEDTLADQNIEWQRYETFPSPFNIIMWITNVESDSGFYMGYYSLLDEDTHVDFTYFRKNHQLLAPMSDNEQLIRLTKLSKNWYKIVPADNGALLYQDLRFSTIEYPPTTDSRFAFTYLIKENPDVNQGILIERLPINYDQRLKTLTGLWKRLWGKNKHLSGDFKVFPGSHKQHSNAAF
jgi:inner membrane protein